MFRWIMLRVFSGLVFLLVPCLGELPLFAVSSLRKKGQSNCVAKGICHRCLAGTDGFPFSHCGRSPRFLQTVNSAAAAICWDEPSPLTRLLPQMPNDLPQFYRADIWRSWHLGLGRYFLSSAIVLLMPLFPGTSVPTKFEGITRKWRAYCKFRKRKPILIRIKMDTVNYGPLEWPDGGWQKADTTTLLCVACQRLYVDCTFCHYRCACLFVCSVDLDFVWLWAPAVLRGV